MISAPPKSSKKRIAFVFNTHYFLGGGEHSLALLIERIDQNAFCPLVIAPEHGEIEAHFASQGRHVFVVPFAPLRHVARATPFRSLLTLLKTLRNNHADLIHANGSRACFYSVLAGVILRIPVLWHVRETIQDYDLYDGLMARLASRIVCVSKTVARERFGRFAEAVQTKTSVIHNGVDTECFRPDEARREQTRKHLGVPEKAVLFGLVGNIIALKGQDFFLRGFAHARVRNPQLTARICMAGRPLEPSFLSYLMDLASSLEMHDLVHFLDYQSDVTGLLSGLDVFVLTSKREGFSRSLLEAMASGLPILATRLAEIEEAVADSENAILVNQGDEPALTEAILRLASDPILRAKMGQRNRQRAVQQFDSAVHVKTMESLYSSMLGQNEI
ncbi:MAG: glycosyltransferase family 4 protein [Thermodesulfobacteriota bacterium]